MAIVVIVSGPPASGKSTMARLVAGRLGLPLYRKDLIKEALFDSLGWSDRAQSRQFGQAAMTMLYRLVDDCLSNGADCAAEANFRPDECDASLTDLLARTSSGAVQVQCGADGEQLVRRFVDRAVSDRHPGHGDAGNVAEFLAELRRGFYRPLAIPGPVVTVDTTDRDEADLTPYVDEVEAALAAMRSSPGLR